MERSYGGGNTGSQSFLWFLVILGLAVGVIGLVLGAVAIVRIAALPTSCTCNTSTLQAEIVSLNETIALINTTLSNSTGSAENVTTWPPVTQSDGSFGWGAASAMNWVFTVVSRGTGSDISSVTFTAIASGLAAVNVSAGTVNPWVVQDGSEGNGVFPDHDALKPRDGFRPTTWLRCTLGSDNVIPVLVELVSDGSLQLTLFNQTGSGTQPLTGPPTIPGAWGGMLLSCDAVFQMTYYQGLPPS